MWDWATWDWAGFGKVALGAGFGTAVVQILIAAVRDWLKARSHAAHLAQRLVVAFEQYADTAARIIALSEEHDISGGHQGSSASGTPDSPAMPDDQEGWRCLSKRLRGRVLSFPQAEREAWSAQSHLFDSGDPTDAELGVELVCAAVGLEATAIAAGLRRKYRLGPPRKNAGQPFKAKIAKVAAWEAEMAKRYPPQPWTLTPPPTTADPAAT